MYWLAVVLATILMRLVFWPRIKGRSNLPKTGKGLVLVFNHKSNFDPILLLCATPRKLRFLAKAELFRLPWSLFFNWMGVIAIDRSRKNNQALEAAVRVLKSGGVVAVAPEGTRNKTAQTLLPFKYGAVAMASRAQVPVMPVTITGRYLPFFGKLKLEYGKPMMVGEDLEAANSKVFKTIESTIKNNEEK
jgi:1-acyl-sn-glycerol-3-phosphate acyltransferase